jgi:hypothetical protein
MEKIIKLAQVLVAAADESGLDSREKEAAMRIAVELVVTNNTMRSHRATLASLEAARESLNNKPPDSSHSL